MSSLLYIHEHLQCKNYLSDDRCAFSQYRLITGEHVNIHSLNQYLFIFVLSGKLEVTDEDGHKFLMEAARMYSFGHNPAIFVNPLEDSGIIILTFDRPQILCDEFNLIGLKKYLPKEDLPLRSLPFIEQIFSFMNTMQMYLDNKMLCKHLQGIKQSEFFFLMRGFYTKEENAMFFYPIIERNNSFRALVKEKANDVETVKDLAEACNMTTKTFTRKFKETFKETPKQWLLTRKKLQVKLDVLRADNLKELQGKAGFSSYAHLNEYCIKQFDKSIKELRDSED
ncbi:MAG: helix-turn-helix domain-containing protein [Bacteroidia bacterium]|nr:helix-turn-helix domain-containing protein [Bacteroidia bacterium]